MKKLNSLFSAALVTVALASMPGAHANVSLKNGNFFIGYIDIVYPGGFEPKIERVYNSKTAFNGMFGWGWGNDYETYLTVSADGSVMVHEYGGGAENRFVPVAFKPEELDKAAEMITAVAKKEGLVGSADQLSSYQKKIKSDATFRNDEWEKFIASGKLQPRQLTAGSQLHSNRFSYQYITKVAGGYVRNFDNGRVEKFDERGKLVRIGDKNNNFIELAYGKDGKLAKLTDNFNRKMFFTFNTQGLLQKVQGENGKEAAFKYNELGELVSSKDTAGNTYAYKYTSDKRHNLAEIAYTDKSTMQIAYFDRSKNENVKSVKDRDGTLTEYTYDYDSSDKGHYTVAVNVKTGQGKPISSSKYEYFIKTKSDGEDWTQRLVTTLDGDVTDTTYNEQFGLPTKIKRAGEETLFEYDNKGHVTRKTTPNEVTELAYDNKAGKVAKVARFEKEGKKLISSSEFQYDERGNLVYAKNNANKGVKLFYDTNGRIKSMLDQNKRQINFKYNENSKPVEITDPALGSITVSYTNSGEIKKVESTAGRKIALQVTSAFQNLLEIIRPAGVSLSF